MKPSAAARRVTTLDHPFFARIVDGLSRPAKTLPTAFLYDERGSRLFDAICELPEYYLTRTELSIMRTDIEAIADTVGPRAMIVEYGSGSSVKTRLLLEHLRDPVAYVPVDISREHLLASADALALRFATLEVLPVCTDFTRPFVVPTPARAPDRTVVYFPGSTIGNFMPAAATALLRQMAQTAGPGGGLLIGVDLRKDPAILHAAYDDPAGVTAAFNLNLLERANRELDADFDLSAFAHEAVWDDAAGRIQMRLVSQRDQTVTIAGHRFAFSEGERIHTEDSHKYTIDGFADLAGAAGFALREIWTDPQRWFSLHAYDRT